MATATATPLLQTTMTRAHIARARAPCSLQTRDHTIYHHQRLSHGHSFSQNHPFLIVHSIVAISSSKSMALSTTNNQRQSKHSPAPKKKRNAKKGWAPKPNAVSQRKRGNGMGIPCCCCNCGQLQPLCAAPEQHAISAQRATVQTQNIKYVFNRKISSIQGIY